MILDGEILYNVAAGLGFFAYLLTNVLWLRILLIIGACFYIVAGVVLGLNSMIGWHIAYVLINLGHVIILLLNNHVTSLPESVRMLYSEKFSAIKPREFKKLIAINPEAEVDSVTVLEQGQNNSFLYLITEGEMLINVDQVNVARIGKGDFFGEMSFLSNSAATSDVVADGKVRYIQWSKADMRSIQQRNLSLYNRFMMAVGLNVVEKLKITTSKHSSILA